MSNLRVGNCRLCGNRSKLQESHIVPKSIGKWLRETSATGYLRSVGSPNKRLQDLHKMPLFCSECEQSIGRDEKYFKERIFLPIHYEVRATFEYEESLLRFAVSLAFRTLCYYERIDPPKGTDAAELLGASYRWQRYLLGKESSPGFGSHHMFIVDPVEDHLNGLRRTMNSYLLRSVSIDILRYDGRVAVLTKLPWFIFMSEVTDVPLLGWKDTQLSQKGTIPRQQSLTDESFLDYMMDRAHQTETAIQAMSPKQQQVISSDALRAPERAYYSQSFDLHRFEKSLSSNFED